MLGSAVLPRGSRGASRRTLLSAAHAHAAESSGWVGGAQGEWQTHTFGCPRSRKWGRGGGAGTARNRTANASGAGGGGDAAGDAGRSEDADQDPDRKIKNKKGSNKQHSKKKTKTRESDAEDEEEYDEEKENDTGAEKAEKKKRAHDEGEDENSTDGAMNSTSEEPDEPKTAERKVYRREREKRKLRKLDDGAKLEIVHVSAHNSSDFDNMILRPMGWLRSKNEQSRRARTDAILECEGGRLDP